MGPTWVPPGSCRPQMGPMMAPRTLLSGMLVTRAPVRWYAGGSSWPEHTTSREVRGWLFGKCGRVKSYRYCWDYYTGILPYNAPVPGNKSHRIWRSHFNASQTDPTLTTNHGKPKFHAYYGIFNMLPSNRPLWVELTYTTKLTAIVKDERAPLPTLEASLDKSFIVTPSWVLSGLATSSAVQIQNYSLLVHLTCGNDEIYRLW